MGKYSDASERSRVGVSRTYRDSWVYVAPSKFLGSIKVSGSGLYASKAFKSGDAILEYKGRILSNAEADAKLHHRNYLFDVKKGSAVVHVIDAADNKYSSAAKFANSTNTWEDARRNSEFKQHGQKIYLVASRAIAPNDEFLAYYGPHTQAIIHET